MVINTEIHDWNVQRTGDCTMLTRKWGVSISCLLSRLGIREEEKNDYKSQVGEDKVTVLT